MRKILLVLLVCFAATAQAQTRFIRNDSAATLQGTNLEISSGAVTASGALQCSLAGAFQGTASAIQLEDTSVSELSSVMMIGARRIDSPGVNPGTAGDAGFVNQNSLGALWVDVSSTAQSATATSLLKLEDAVAASADAGVGVLGVINATSAAKAADGDYTVPALDTAGRQIVSAAASTSMVVGCSSAIITATTGQVIAAVASNFTFITSLSCTNTGAAATRVILEDGDGTDLANVMLAATTGFASVTFPTPVRTNVVNRAIQINVITTSSSTICCASGYTGII